MGNTISANRQIARATGIVMVGMALSSLTGLVSTMLVSRVFGTSAEIDAFYAANRLTEILFALMAGGALASAFVPTFTGFLTRDDHQNAWRLASQIANLILVVLGMISGLCWIFAPWLVRHVLAPGFQDTRQILLTIELLRIMLLTPTIFGLSGLLMSILNAHQHFILPAIAPASYRLGWILGVTVLAPRMGGVYGLAWGVVLGASLHLLVQLPALRGRRARYQASLGLRNPAVHHVGLLMAPRLLGAAVVQLNFLVNTIIASSQPEGSLTAINFAFALMIMPQAVIAQAAGIAALPTLSSQVARGKLDEMHASIISTMRGVLFLAIPASLGLILLRRPIVSLLLERGAFDAQSTDLVSWALLWYAAGLSFHALLEIVVRAFYAMHDTRTPVLVGTIAMSLNVILSLFLSDLFARIGWMPHGGLALANSLATLLESLTLLLLIRRRLGGLLPARLRIHLLRTLIAVTLMSFSLMIWLRVMAGRSALWIGMGGAMVGMLVYWGVGYLLGSPEARQLPKLVRQQYQERVS